MIVTCPECATRFLIDPRSLGIAGRSVRCTHCSHVWMQLPPEDAPRRVDLPLPGTDKPQAARPAAPTKMPPPPPPPAPQAVEPPPKAALPPPPTPPPADAAATDSTLVRGGNRPLVIALLAILILGGLWYARNFIVERVPALGGVYAFFGVAVGASPDDLEFRDVTSNRRQENGHAMLVIEGEVANVSQGSRRVPPVRIVLEDSSRHPIKTWTVVATGDPLPPGETVPFRSSITDPGVGTVGASVSFDGD